MNEGAYLNLQRVVESHSPNGTVEIIVYSNDSCSIVPDPRRKDIVALAERQYKAGLFTSKRSYLVSPPFFSEKGIYK